MPYLQWELTDTLSAISYTNGVSSLTYEVSGQTLSIVANDRCP